MEILKLKPCDPAIKYRKEFNSFEDAWNNCPRGDWMLWIASRLEVDKKLLVKTAGRCAATVKHLMKDKRSLDALQACEDYGNGKINDDELSVFADAAWSATDADADAAWDAASSTNASWATAAAADAAYYAAADAACASADAAWDSVYALACSSTAYVAFCAAEKENQLLTANICRELLTEEVFKLIKNI